MKDLKNKMPDVFRWIFALPIAIVAMCIAQVVLTFIAGIFYEFNKFQLFNFIPNEINYFLINFGATYSFLSVFYGCVPKYKFKITLALATTYILMVLSVSLLLIINKKFSVDYPFTKVLNEDLGIVFGCVATMVQLKAKPENARSFSRDY